MWTREETYQTRKSARALMTKARPRKDSLRCLQEDSTFSTAVMRGLQFISSRSPAPIETSRTLILIEDRSKLTGGSWRRDHESRYRPLDLERFSFQPKPFSRIEYVSNVAIMASSVVTIIDVSSAYWEMGDSGVEAQGRERPQILGLARMETARTSETRTYNNGDKGQPWSTQRDKERGSDR